MKLLICDDEKFITEQMTEMCERYSDEELPGLEFLAVNDFADKGNFEADVIFLDVEMPGKNGILIKDELEATENEALIIFVTNYVENVFSAFGKNVIGFFKKPLKYQQFCELMEKARNLRRGHQIINIQPNMAVKAADIELISMDGVYSEIYMSGANTANPKLMRKSLGEWEKLLPRDMFMTISKSYLVNCSHIKSFDGDVIIMEESGKKLTVSRRRRKECSDRYGEYCRKMARYGKR